MTKSNFVYSSPAASLGRGLRDAAHKIVTDYVPGPDAYKVEKGSLENNAPKVKFPQSKRPE